MSTKHLSKQVLNLYRNTRDQLTRSETWQADRKKKAKKREKRDTSQDKLNIRISVLEMENNKW